MSSAWWSGLSQRSALASASPGVRRCQPAHGEQHGQSATLDVDVWQQYGDLFSLWEVPVDLQPLDMTFLAQRPEALWLWCLVKEPGSRQSFAQAIQRGQSVKSAVEAALEAWRSLDDAARRQLSNT